MHHFTAQNNVFIQFHPSYFLVKDTNSGVILAKSVCENSVYILPNTLAATLFPMVTNVHEKTSFDGWHKRLGHPSSKIVHNVVRQFSLPFTTTQKSSLCPSCSIDKAHQQPFRSTSISSTAPLNLIYTDVWGPAHCVGLDGFRYYLIFIDHHTKYMWFYSMETKSEVSYFSLITTPNTCDFIDHHQIHVVLPHFSLITTPNTCGFILWKQNLRCLNFH